MSIKRVHLCFIRSGGMFIRFYVSSSSSLMLPLGLNYLFSKYNDKQRNRSEEDTRGNIAVSSTADKDTIEPKDQQLQYISLQKALETVCVCVALCLSTEETNITSHNFHQL